MAERTAHAFRLGDLRLTLSETTEFSSMRLMQIAKYSKWVDGQRAYHTSGSLSLLLALALDCNNSLHLGPVSMARSTTTTTEINERTTIALLGVTGNTGQVVLRQLLTNDSINLRVYARSHAKVTRMFPTISQHTTVSLFTGSINDERLIADLLENVSIVVCTIGSDGFSPARMQRDAASSIMSALKKSRSGTESWRAPRLIWLSSSSTNKRFAAARPALVNWLIQHAFWYGYDDLWAAQRIIQARQDLASVILIQPGVLVDEAATGHELSVESVKLAASYEDLGAAITQVALDRSFDSLDQIGVSSKKGDRVLRYAPYIVTRLIRGFLTNYVPLGIWLDAKLVGLIRWYAM